MAVPSLGQAVRATVSGVVTDASGAAVAGAQVAVVETNTNVRTATKTEENGHYTIPSSSRGITN